MREIQGIIGYKFKNKSLIRTAMTHSSYANENKSSGVKSYERLEFLGDAILGFITGEFLFRNRQNAEGDLARMRAALVCEPNLARIAEKLGLGRFILLGKGEEQSRGRERQSILADVLEAIIGAIYIDGGIENASSFINRYILSDAEDLNVNMSGDFKTELQELVQRNRSNTLSYRLVEERGPDHRKSFKVQALINDEPVGDGWGRSKKEAEQEAAGNALKHLRKDAKT
jgi:ribonuclease-3